MKHEFELEPSVTIHYSLNYSPAEAMTHDHPGCPEEFEVYEFEICIDGDTVDEILITACDLKVNYTDEQIQELVIEDWEESQSE